MPNAIPPHDPVRPPQPPAPGGSQPLVVAKGVGKRFGAVTALQDVDFHIDLGEIVALIGDNGAGKSTFVKILSGAHPATSGELYVGGRRVSFASPIDAGQHGIATIYQELALADNLAVYQNVFLGRELKRSVLGIPVLDRSAMKDRVRELLRDLDAHVPSVIAPVSSLSGGQRQAVAIARALNLDAQLVIMDEPTAALAVAETRKVLDLILQLKSQGKAVLLISHNMTDVFEVADRMVVLRRGRKVGERRKEHTDMNEIVALITGVSADTPSAT